MLKYSVFIFSCYAFVFISWQNQAINFIGLSSTLFAFHRLIVPKGARNNFNKKGEHYGMVLVGVNHYWRN